MMVGTNTAFIVDSETSRKFATMSFICAVLIVVLHTFAARPNNFPDLVVQRLFQCGLCRIAIPWFFFSAGYFLAGHMNEDEWWFAEVKKRIRSLMVPFWIWDIICFVFYLSFAILMRLAHYEYQGFK